MNRLSNKELALTQSLVKSPFDDLLSTDPITSDSPLEARIDRLSQLLDGLNALEKECQVVEKTNATLTLGGMLLGGLAVSSCAALGVLGAAIVPIVAGASVIGLLGSAGTQQAKIMKLEKTSEQFRLAISSSPIIYWAALWQIGGTELFMSAVEDAADVTVVDGEIQFKGDNPLTKAITKVARRKGWHYDDLLDACEAIANEYTENTPVLGQKRPTFPNAPQKPSITQQQKPIAAIEIAAAIGADLAEGVKKAKEERKTALKVEPFVQPVTRIQPPVLPTADVVDKRTQDIVELILKVTNSLTFIGAQRCGKSYLMALASRIGVQTGRFTKVSVISSLTKAGEDSEYWKHCTTQAFYDLKRVINKTQYYEEYLQVIQDFKATATAENPQLLIIDEFSFLAQCLGQDKDTEAAEELAKELINLATVCGSASEKNGWYVWLGTPQGNVTNIPTELRPVMKQFSLVMAAIAPGVTVPTSTGGSVTWDDTIFTDTERNFPVLKGRMPPRGAAKDLSERIVFLNGKWYKSSAYTLESVVDAVDQTKFKQELASRDALSLDERKSLKTAVAVQEKSRADKLAEEMIAKLESSQCGSLEEFIEYELDAGDRMSEVKPRIIAVLRKYNRQDLLKRFAAN
jgi:hypothetical protein